MQEQFLIQKLENAKVETSKKWIYNLIAWSIKNSSSKNIVDFERRIESSIRYAKGKYIEYWNNPLNKKRHSKSQLVCLKNNRECYLDITKKFNLERRVVHKLYKEGFLPKRLTQEIETIIKEVQ